MKLSKWRHSLVVVAAPLLLLCSCATEAIRASSDQRPEQASGASQTQAVEPSESDNLQRPILVQDDQAPVSPDLEQLAEMFVRYAVGNSRTFPHRESVSTSLGGRSAVSIDDVAAALATRKIWRICPAHWDVYGASSCPVDLLGPITATVANSGSLIYSAEYGDVTCAPTRTGPLPSGRIVVLRPSQEWRTCASDFALVLAADDQGRLQEIDLMLSDP